MKRHAVAVAVLALAACSSPPKPPAQDFANVPPDALPPPGGGLVAARSGGDGGGGGGGTPTPGAPATPQPAGTLQATIPVGASPRGLALDGRGRVWVAVNGTNEVKRLEETSATQSISVDSPVDLVFDASSSVWVASAGGIFGFDASGSRLVGAPGAEAGAVAVAGSFLYAALPRDGVIRRYPIDRAGLGPPLTLPGSSGTPRDLLVAGGRLWAALGEANLVARYDTPETSALTPVLIGQVGDEPAGLARDASGSVLALGRSTIAVVSESPARFLINRSELTGATRLTADRAGLLWCAITTRNQLVAVAADGKLAAPAPLGLSGPLDILSDASGRLWVSNEQGGTVMRFAGS